MESETRTKLLQATRSIIDEKGLDAVTLRAVGARAGLSRSAPYRHFNDKEGLLAAIATENLEQMLRSFERLSYSTLEPKEAVRRLLLDLHSFGLSSRVYYQLMFATIWNTERFPELHRSGKMVFEQAHALIARLLPSAKATHSQTLRRTAITYAFIHGLVELHLAGHMENMKGLDDTDKLIEEFIALLIAI